MDDPFRWISKNILMVNSRMKSWFECLEVVISGHTEPTQGTAWPLESSDFRDISNQRNSSDQVLSRLRSSSGVGNPISPSLTPPGFPNPCEFFLYLNCGHDMKPIGWWSYRVRVKYSLVLLEMFSHPCPTLVPSYPHPYSQLGTPIVLSGKLELSFYLYNRIPSKWGWVKINWFICDH